MIGALGPIYRRATTGPAFIQARYGSARGMVRLWLSSLSQALGARRHLEWIEWERVERLVFVCAGNICRSPYAAARAAQQGFPAISVALHGASGYPADRQAQLAAQQLGADLGEHRSLSIDDADIGAGDLLLAMEPRQAIELETRYADSGAQVTLLGLWSKPQRPHVHDPHRLSPDYFRTCFRTIDDAVAGVLARVHR